MFLGIIEFLLGWVKISMEICVTGYSPMETYPVRFFNPFISDGSMILLIFCCSLKLYPSLILLAPADSVFTCCIISCSPNALLRYSVVIGSLILIYYFCVRLIEDRIGILAIGLF